MQRYFSLRLNTALQVEPGKSYFLRPLFFHRAILLSGKDLHHLKPRGANRDTLVQRDRIDIASRIAADNYEHETSTSIHRGTASLCARVAQAHTVAASPAYAQSFAPLQTLRQDVWSARYEVASSTLSSEMIFYKALIWSFVIFHPDVKTA